jgi:hypothetical protein
MLGLGVPAFPLQQAQHTGGRAIHSKSGRPKTSPWRVFRCYPSRSLQMTVSHILQLFLNKTNSSTNWARLHANKPGWEAVVDRNGEILKKVYIARLGLIS